MITSLAIPRDLWRSIKDGAKYPVGPELKYGGKFKFLQILINTIIYIVSYIRLIHVFSNDHK
jgi:hypothetical protein